MNLKNNDPKASILKLLRIEKDCYDQILDLQKEQLLAIEQEDEKRLDAVIENKDRLLKTAGNNEVQLKEALAPLSRESLAEVGKQAGQLKMEIESVLAQIIDMENNCQVELKARKFIVQDKILDLKQNRSLLKGYGKSNRVKPKISKSV